MDWTHRLIDTLSYRELDSISDGDITYGSLQTCAVRIEEFPDIVKANGGAELQTSHLVWTQTDITIQARVWIDSTQTGDTSKAVRILKKERAKTLDGNYTGYKYTLGR